MKICKGCKEELIEDDMSEEYCSTCQSILRDTLEIVNIRETEEKAGKYPNTTFGSLLDC